MWRAVTSDERLHLDDLAHATRVVAQTLAEYLEES